MSSAPLPLIDSHAHLYWSRFEEDRAAVLEHAAARGVQHIVVPGTNCETSLAARELCAGQPNLHFAAGLHPSDTAEDGEEARALIARLCAEPECVAVGETGLDFFHQNNPSAAVQEAAFRWHLELALQLDKPVIVHCRDAHDETARCLADYPGVRGVMHCFTMGPDEMQLYLDLGLHISFSGVVTYPKNDANRAAARAVPADRILIETDSPFLAPQPERGRRNEPAFVEHVLHTIAQERGVAPEVLAEQTTTNARELFRLP